MKSILVVEDDKEIRSSLADLLEINGYTVETAIDGRQGLEKLSNDLPDLIISDVMMPVMDGFEFLKLIRSDSRTELIPVIMLTAKVALEAKLRGLELGADDYLSKPFEFRVLELKIFNFIERQKKIMDKKAGETFESQDDIFIKKLNFLLGENIQNSKLSVNDIASLLNMSVSTFNRKHHKVLGKTPNQYLKEFRLDKARKMIRINYGNISEIAIKSGFGSQSYFSTVYREFYGVSPTEELA